MLPLFLFQPLKLSSQRVAIYECRTPAHRDAVLLLARQILTPVLLPQRSADDVAKRRPCFKLLNPEPENDSVHGKNTRTEPGSLLGLIPYPGRTWRVRVTRTIRHI